MRNAIYKIGRSEDIWVRQQWKPSTVCETSPPFMLLCFVLKTENYRGYYMHPETSSLASPADKTRPDVQHKLQVKNPQKIIVVAYKKILLRVDGFFLLFCASNFYSYKTPIIGILANWRFVVKNAPQFSSPILCIKFDSKFRPAFLLIELSTIINIKKKHTERRADEMMRMCIEFSAVEGWLMFRSTD